jgi:hypothetical protein
MEAPQLIYRNIIAVMKEIGPLSKDRKNTQQGYAFRGIDDLMNAISPVLSNHGVFPTCLSVTDVLSENVTSKNGGAGYRQIRRYTFRFFAEDGSFVDTTADGEAIDYGDKGSNKAYSVAYREAMFKMFVIPFESEDIEAADHDLKTSQTRHTAPGAAKPAPTKKGAPSEIDVQKERITFLLKSLGFKGKTKKEYEDAVFDITALLLIEENYAAIAEALSARLEAKEEEANQ